MIIDNAVIYILQKPSIYKALHESNRLLAEQLGQFQFIAIVVVGPLIEELVFRLPLNGKRSFLGFSLSLAFFLLGGFYSLGSAQLDHKLSVGIITSLVFYFFLMLFFSKKRFTEQNRDSYIKLLFYVSTVLFALSHISNFKPLQYSLIWLYPVYVLPQFIMGVGFAFARMRYGFGWAILLHMLVNTPFTIINYL
ncbi:CPBP family glutamic-type intramembrane protease [Niabella insulamsoli]|uniref:CPBP family glutamic-type intramembrane protease n=1 Tax=Niabella insulamsoli TaxID=3144874 RepID=UPI0031FBB176